MPKKPKSDFLKKFLSSKGDFREENFPLAEDAELVLDTSSKTPLKDGERPLHTV